MHKVIDLYPQKGRTSQNRPHLPTDLKELKEQLKTELLSSLNQFFIRHERRRLRKWLSPRQVQAKLNISPSTLRRLKESGSLPFYVAGGIIYYDPEDVDRELRRRKGSKVN